MVSTEHSTVLLKICAALEDCIFDWALTGSLGFALQGVPVIVHDIDIQTNMSGALAIEKRFSAFVKQRVSFSSTDRIRSYFGALEIDGITVEIMGNLQKRLPDGDWEDPVDIKRHKLIVPFDKMQVPVLSLRYECEAYRKLGRIDKAGLLTKWLHEHPDY